MGKISNLHYCTFNNFFCCFFQKQDSKDHLTQGNLLKTTLLNEKQRNFEKELHVNISLYSQYFSSGAGINVQITYLYFLRQRKSILFFLLRSKKLNI